MTVPRLPASRRGDGAAMLLLAAGLPAALDEVLGRVHRPAGVRRGILTEASVDPAVGQVLDDSSDRCGYPAGRFVARLLPRPGEDHLRGGDVADFARRYGHEYATVVLTAANPGAQHALDVAAVTAAARAAGCVVGWDVSRLGGDPRPMLPEWGVDFACWTAAGGSGGACAWIAGRAA